MSGVTEKIKLKDTLILSLKNCKMRVLFSCVKIELVEIREEFMKKYALVTGGSGGIGSAISKQLIQDGYTVYVHYNNSEEKVLELQKAWEKLSLFKLI